MHDDKFQPMSIGTIYSHAAKLFGTTAFPAGLIGLIVLIPLTLFSGTALRGFFYSMATFAEQTIGTSPDEMSEAAAMQLGQAFLGPAVLAFFANLILIVGVTYVLTLITIYSWNALVGNNLGSELLKDSLRKPFWITLVQTLMIGILLFVSFLVFTLIIAVFTVSESGTISAPLLPYLFFLPATYFIVATVFRVHLIYAEERGPWHGMIASIALVRGNWWRVLAILAIPFILLLIVIVPLSFLFSGSEWFNYVGIQQTSAGTPQELAVKQFRAIADSLTWEVFVFQAFQNALTILIFVNILTPLYVDLRARRGDFEYEEEGYALPE